MTPKLLAFDLDDTLLDQNSRLSPGNRAALLRAAEQGIEIVIASGRAYDTLPKELLVFPGIHWAICSNGAGVYDTKTGTAILHRTLFPGSVEQILSLTKGEHLTFEAFVDGKAYAAQGYIEEPFEFLTDNATARYLKASRRPVQDILAFIGMHIHELDSLDLVVDSLETKARMLEKLKNLEEVYITSSVPRLIEISHRDCGKHRALEFLCSHLDVPREAVVAFGNGDNDAEMLAWAGTGVAVANATEACKAAADLITDHCDSDGVAKALKTLI